MMQTLYLAVLTSIGIQVSTAGSTFTDRNEKFKMMIQMCAADDAVIQRLRELDEASFNEFAPRNNGIENDRPSQLGGWIEGRWYIYQQDETLNALHSQDAVISYQNYKNVFDQAIAERKGKDIGSSSSSTNAVSQIVSCISLCFLFC